MLKIVHANIELLKSDVSACVFIPSWIVFLLQYAEEWIRQLKKLLVTVFFSEKFKPWKHEGIIIAFPYLVFLFVWCSFWRRCNSLSLSNNLHLIFLCSNTAESLLRIKRIKTMIFNLIKKLWLLHKFSLSAQKEMYREEYGEYGY